MELNNLNSLTALPSSGELQKITQYDIVDVLQMDFGVVFLILNVLSAGQTQTAVSNTENEISQALTDTSNVATTQKLSSNNTSSSSSSSSWGYHGYAGPMTWAAHTAACAGFYQSPIDITRSSVIPIGSGSIQLVDFDKEAQVELKNNGHSVYANIRHNTMTIQNGGLSAPYQAVQFHFHWGANDGRGSEHTLDGESFPMEMHVVLFKQMYGKLSTALLHPGGVAVLGAFFEMSSEDNGNFTELVDKLEDISSPNDKVNFTVKSLKALLPSFDNYYRYHGSLTTPPCSETVIWNISTGRVRISEDQMQKFRKVVSSERDWSGSVLPLVDNYRPVQNLYGRRITSNTAI